MLTQRAGAYAHGKESPTKGQGIWCQSNARDGIGPAGGYWLPGKTPRACPEYKHAIRRWLGMPFKMIHGAFVSVIVLCKRSQCCRNHRWWERGWKEACTNTAWSTGMTNALRRDLLTTPVNYIVIKVQANKRSLYSQVNQKNFWNAKRIWGGENGKPGTFTGRQDSHCIQLCPGFGQDRVNFQQNPGRDTAGWADPAPTWPNRAGYSTPCAVMLGPGVGGRCRGNSLAAREGAVAVRSERAVLFCGFVLCIPLFCIVVATVSLCLLFC